MSQEGCCSLLSVILSLQFFLDHESLGQVTRDNMTRLYDEIMAYAPPAGMEPKLLYLEVAYYVCAMLRAEFKVQDIESIRCALERLRMVVDSNPEAFGINDGGIYNEINNMYNRLYDLY